MSELILGVGGYARSGKDTLADLLVDNFGFVKVCFADPMRAMAEAINPVVGLLDDVDEHRDFDVLRYNDVVEMFGYDEAKRLYPEVREFLQRLGTDAGRQVIGDSFWVDIAMKAASEHRLVVIPDMRFHNEAEAIKSSPGSTVRVDRRGVEAPNSHQSEHDLDGWPYDLFVHNNSTPLDMLDRVEQFFARSNPRVLRTS